MPTYDYECGACAHAFEHFQSMSSRRLRKCPECGEKKLERLFGIGSGVIFKGSGFYETDYKRAGQKASNGGGESSSSDSSSSDSSSSDSSSGDGSSSGDSSSSGTGSSDASSSGGDSKGGDG